MPRCNLEIAFNDLFPLHSAANHLSNHTIFLALFSHRILQPVGDDKYSWLMCWWSIDKCSIRTYLQRRMHFDVDIDALACWYEQARWCQNRCAMVLPTQRHCLSHHNFHPMICDWTIIYYLFIYFIFAPHSSPWKLDIYMKITICLYVYILMNK